ncbi:hypothetical protein [Macrococcus bovicus]|uniref:hypothetical protein n=1 Tax=Macrococcus bovicus TaxID=69968 RepID=UPI0025A68359|nr:hypothetical protein [Macrococcus bovicus]WJP97100.1 hypothetical protein QSV55_07385 [Macrococcus bovicus]
MVSRLTETLTKRRRHINISERTTTEYHFGPHEREKYITNLQDLEEQSADITFNGFDDAKGGRIEIRHRKY